MTTIHLETIINAPIDEVFDLSRDIDFHIISASNTYEKAIAGKTSGLINMNETVTWRGKHFGMFLEHKSKITTFNRPYSFTDEMIKGHFKSFEHQHLFKVDGYNTVMMDLLTYETPYGILGDIFNRFKLKKHLTSFLSQRNSAIKDYLSKSQHS